VPRKLKKNKLQKFTKKIDKRGEWRRKLKRRCYV
jgi:hypothetical protein